MKPVAAQNDSASTRPTTHILHTRDGSTLIGHVVSEDSAEVQFETSGGVLTIRRANIADLTAVASENMHDGEYWYPDPNDSRLLLAPTARTLKSGTGYYQNTYLVLQNAVVGLTDNVTVGGGFTLIPGVSPSDWGYYALPKVRVYDTPSVSAAVGGVLLVAPGEAGAHAGLLYGVGTFGPPDGSVTAGVGWGYEGSSIATSPAFLLGGERRVSRRIGLVTENYGVWMTSDTYVCGAGGCADRTTKNLAVLSLYGLRFIGEKMNVDFALFNLAGNGAEWVFPGIPYLAFSVRF